MEFLRSEFESVPNDIVQATLSSLERSIRSAKQLSTSDSARYELACIAICAQLKAALDLCSAIKRQSQDREEPAK